MCFDIVSLVNENSSFVEIVSSSLRDAKLYRLLIILYSLFFLLLLVDNNGLVDSTTISIDNHFEQETSSIKKLCEGHFDNISQITQFLNNSLKPKLPNKVFNYCKELDKAYQSVIINVDNGIQDINTKRDLIYTNQKIALNDKKEYNLDENIRELKSQILEKILLWFKVFNIEFAYDKAKKQHRTSART